MKHTPSRWEVIQGEEPHVMSIHEDALPGNIICFAPKDFGYSMENWEANARLIAAAPELLKVLEATYLRLQILSNRNVNFAINTDRIRATLRNAVSQATGEDAKTVQENCESSAIAKAKL